MNMQNATPDALMETLPDLSKDELRAVQARVQFLLQTATGKATGPAAQAEPNEFAQAMYGAFSDMLKRRFGTRVAPWFVFTQGPQYGNFAAACDLAKEANSAWFPKQTKAEAASMLLMYAGLVIDRLEDRATTIVMPTITFWLGNLPALVDDAFPGYAAAGMLGRVQQLRTKGRR